ncbi:MAG TPA: hypothetical protein VHM88_10825, partial [Candidatus Acidoferrales bacterium]|nr:hypothetical protein [Candidatus Acidoferrales bacterium]
CEFRRFLREDVVRQQGTTLLFASHTLAEVEQLADRIGVLVEGCLLACDTLPRVLTATRATTLEQALERLTGRPPAEASA